VQPILALNLAYGIQPLVFNNGFNAGLAGWSGQVGNVQAAPGAAMGAAGSGGGAGQGLAANLLAPMPKAGAATPTAMDMPQPAYVYDRTPEFLSSYITSFYFDPNDAMTGESPLDIFLGLDSNAEAVFGIQLRQAEHVAGQYELRGWAKADGAEVYTDWVALTNAAHGLQLNWQSGPDGALHLFVDNAEAASLHLDTSLYRVDEVRLGPSRGLEDHTAMGASGIMYFDEFTSWGAEITSAPLVLYIPVVSK